MAWQRDFEVGLVARMNADVSVALATSNNIMPGEAHEQTALPYVIYTVQYQAVDEIGQNGAWTSEIALLAWSTSYDEALDLGEDLMAALKGDNLTLNGVAVRYLRPQAISGVQQALTSGVIHFGSLVEFTAMIDT
jgi:hypothetical protein